MTRIHVFTSAAYNYIPKVRMLFESLRRHHPEFALHLVLADELHADFNLEAEPLDDVLTLPNLDIPNWRGWAFCHSIVELATAIKPFALMKLLARPDCSAVLYLDPDIVVFSRLDEIMQALTVADIALTPHQTKPETSLSAVLDNEICSLKHGIYNLGFIGIRASDEGRRFANWWAQRVYHFCRDDIPNGLFTDQRWIDLVPAFFDYVAILRSSRFNVASWNLTTRDMEGTLENGFLVDGRPLGFYHFTGFDSGAHEIMAEKNSQGNPAVRKLIAWYQYETSSLANDAMAKVPWAYGHFSNREKITAAQRTTYRDRPDLQAAFPDPFDASGDRCYLRWWQTVGSKEYLRSANGTDAPPKAIAPGYRNVAGPVPLGKALKLIKDLVLRPIYGLRMLKRAVVIVRTEGLSGLRRRIRQRVSDN